MSSNHLILCHPLLLLPSTFPSIKVFPNKSALLMYRSFSFSFSISPSNEYSGLISFRIDWFDLPAVQRTLRSLLQQHSLKASILQHSAFFMVQSHSHPYMTTGKTRALTRWTFLSEVMSLLFNTLSRLVIAFLPRSKYLLISWLQSPSAVTLEPKKIKSVPVPKIIPIEWVKVAQSCPTLCNPMDCSLPGSSVHRILQARILKWVTIPFSRGSSQPRDQTQVSHIAVKFFTIWATREVCYSH